MKRGGGDTYDGAGNQTGWQAETGVPGSTLFYDGENRLVQANVTGASAASFVYDGEGRRVQMISGSGTTTTYIHDAKGELAAEYSTAAPTATGTQYLTADTLGSTRLITDASGNPQRCIDYLPFGEEIPANVDGRSGPCYGSLGSGTLTPSGPEYRTTPDSTGDSLKFTGKERDSETGLDFFGARYFSGAQGRFTSADTPFIDQRPGNPQSWNLYAYVRSNPFRAVDPDGHGSICLQAGSCSWNANAFSMGKLGNAVDDAALTDYNAMLNASSPSSDAQAARGQVTARVGRQGTSVTYSYPDGMTVIRAGNYAFVDNNPGNEVAGPGVIGRNGGFVIFDTPEDGWQALRDDLQSHSAQTILEAITRRTPAEDPNHPNPMLRGNDPGSYARTLASTIGVSPSAQISSLAPGQVEQLVRGIGTQEGYFARGNRATYVLPYTLPQ